MENRTNGLVANVSERTLSGLCPAIYLALSAMILALAVTTATARADEFHLLVNGKAVHLDHRPDVQYNESNWGTGFQYDFEKSRANWVPFVTVSGFSDSNSNPSYYAGGGWLKRHSFSLNGHHLHGDVGVVGFLMVREGFRDHKPFPGVLPAFSIGGKRASVNITYIPRVDPKMVPILFFQLKLKLSAF